MWRSMKYIDVLETLASQGFSRKIVDAIVSENGKPVALGSTVELKSEPGKAALAIRDGRGSDRKFRFEIAEKDGVMETVYIVRENMSPTMNLQSDV